MGVFDSFNENSVADSMQVYYTGGSASLCGEWGQRSLNLTLTCDNDAEELSVGNIAEPIPCGYTLQDCFEFQYERVIA